MWKLLGIVARLSSEVSAIEALFEEERKRNRKLVAKGKGGHVALRASNKELACSSAS